MRSWGVAIGMMGPKFWQLYRKEGLMRTVLRGKPYRPTHEKAGFGDELATLVGTDEYGNRYYEDWNGKNKNQRRFVEFADNGKWVPTQGKKICPGWQGWMHYQYDDPPKVSFAPTPADWRVPCRKTISSTPSSAPSARSSSRRTTRTPIRTQATSSTRSGRSLSSSSARVCTPAGSPPRAERPAKARRSSASAPSTTARPTRSRTEPSAPALWPRASI